MMFQALGHLGFVVLNDEFEFFWEELLIVYYVIYVFQFC